MSSGRIWPSMKLSYKSNFKFVSKIKSVCASDVKQSKSGQSFDSENRTLPTSFDSYCLLWFWSKKSEFLQKHMSRSTSKPAFGVWDQGRLYYTILAANNKGADKTARMRRLICAFVVSSPEPKAHLWDYRIGRPPSSVCPSVVHTL